MKAHELLSDESKWCKGWNAQDKHGQHRTIFDADAVKFCIRGAICRAYDVNDVPLDKLRERIGPYISQWNDAPERTFAEVKAVLVELDL